jgi:hypothetical protein
MPGAEGHYGWVTRMMLLPYRCGITAKLYDLIEYGSRITNTL